MKLSNEFFQAVHFMMDSTIKFHGISSKKAVDSAIAIVEKELMEYQELQSKAKDEKDNNG